MINDDYFVSASDGEISSPESHGRRFELTSLAFWWVCGHVTALLCFVSSLG